VPIAHSAQITLEAGIAASGLTLRLLPGAAGTTPHITDVSVALEGATVPARPQPDGSWLVQLPPGRAAHDGKLEVYVMHDGIREVLTGTLPASSAAASGGGSGSGLLGAHKQLAWWVLNITIVLIGVLALSRRMS